MAIGLGVESRLTLSLDCLLKSCSSCLALSPVEDTLSLVVAAAVKIVDDLIRADLAGKAVDFLVVQTVEVVLDICPLDQISSFPMDRTVDAEGSTDPDNDFLV